MVHCAMLVSDGEVHRLIQQSVFRISPTKLRDHKKINIDINN